ncbi:MAG TPA: BamA/TamA family outer membrane protein [Burkholderiaceae bacterium]|nr:BamA/TamA family outer membrane protein [Burkholderiaceae bacterium]
MRALVWLLLLALSGCALLARDEPAQKDNTQAPTLNERPGGEPPAPLPRTEGLQIDAPSQLRALLLRNLDLARLASMTGAEAPDETEWLRLVAAAPAQVRELLETEGYFHPEVQVRRDRGPPPVVHVRVVPGPRARIDEVMLSVQGVLRERTDAGDDDARATIQELHAWWPLPPGDVFRNPDWASAKTGALGRLRAAGYASPSIVASSAQVDADSNRVQLTLTLDSGPLYRAGELHVVGLKLHDEAAVRHLAGFDPGTPLTEQLLVDYQERLRKANLYDTIAVTFDNDPSKADASPVTVTLHELPLQSLTLGVGISANTGPRATAEYTHRRIFDYAATLHGKIEYGRDKQSIDAELSSHPGERFYRNMIGLHADRQQTDLDDVLSQSTRVGRTQDTNRIERLYFLGLDRSVQTVFNPATIKEANAVSVQYHGIWRALDSVLLPTRGMSLSGQGGVGWATSNFAESGPFTRLYGRFTGYLPLGTWYTTGRLELGQIFKRDTVAVPDALAFRAGGDESVRGYDYRTLAPTDVDGAIIGGNVLATASIEVARPFERLPSVWWAVFFDLGRAAESWKGFTPARGYGVGVRWRSPVGPLRADVAYGEELHQVRLHVSVGIAF